MKNGASLDLSMHARSSSHSIVEQKDKELLSNPFFWLQPASQRTPLYVAIEQNSPADKLKEIITEEADKAIRQQIIRGCNYALQVGNRLAFDALLNLKPLTIAEKVQLLPALVLAKEDCFFKNIISAVPNHPEIFALEDELASYFQSTLVLACKKNHYIVLELLFTYASAFLTLAEWEDTLLAAINAGEHSLVAILLEKDQLGVKHLNDGKCQEAISRFIRRAFVFAAQLGQEHIVKMFALKNKPLLGEEDFIEAFQEASKADINGKNFSTMKFLTTQINEKLPTQDSTLTPLFSLQQATTRSSSLPTIFSRFFRSKESKEHRKKNR